jgi:hypothetical protein
LREGRRQLTDYRQDQNRVAGPACQSGQAWNDDFPITFADLLTGVTGISRKNPNSRP